jgi:hypothetical protein
MLARRDTLAGYRRFDPQKPRFRSSFTSGTVPSTITCAGLWGTISIWSDFELISRSRTFPGGVGSRSEFENVSAELLKALSPMQKAVRLLGVSISGFKFDEIRGARQIALEL